MRISSARISCACALVAGLLLSSQADAQLVVGSTTTNTSNPAAIYVDLATNTLVPPAVSSMYEQ